MQNRTKQTMHQICRYLPIELEPITICSSYNLFQVNWIFIQRYNFITNGMVSNVVSGSCMAADKTKYVNESIYQAYTDDGQLLMKSVLMLIPKQTKPSQKICQTQNNRIQSGWFSICLSQLRNLNRVVVICRLEQAPTSSNTLFNYGVHSLTKIRNWLPSFECGRYGSCCNALFVSGRWNCAKCCNLQMLCIVKGIANDLEFTTN